jgi:hypothetical protein
MRRWREAKSLVENVDVELDHYMFRLWLGIPSVATQNRLKPDKFEYMFHMLHLHGFADAHTAPRGNLSREQMRHALSRFTGFT